MNIDPKHVQTLDAIDAIPEIQAVGQAVAKKVQLNHFSGIYIEAVNGSVKIMEWMCLYPKF